MSSYVLDASVAEKLFQYEEHAQAARRILDHPHDLHVPDFFYLEIDNIVCKWMRGNLINLHQARNIRAAVKELPLTVHTWPGLSDEAFDLSAVTNRSLYDCLCMALVTRLDMPMVTADLKLYEALQTGPFAGKMIWVEEIS